MSAGLKGLILSSAIISYYRSAGCVDLPVLTLLSSLFRLWQLGNYYYKFLTVRIVHFSSAASAWLSWYYPNYLTPWNILTQLVHLPSQLVYFSLFLPLTLSLSDYNIVNRTVIYYSGHERSRGTRTLDWLSSVIATEVNYKPGTWASCHGTERDVVRLSVHPSCSRNGTQRNYNT